MAEAVATPKPIVTGRPIAGGPGTITTMNAKTIEAMLTKHKLRVQPVDFSKNLGGERLYIAIEGEKGAGKSGLVVGIPCPYGGKTVIVTFDKATRASLVNRFTPAELEHIMLYEVLETQFDDDGQVIFKGYSRADPMTYEYVASALAGALEEMKGYPVDNLYLDHAGACFEEVCESFARIEAKKLDSGEKLELGDWNARLNKFREIVDKFSQIPRHAFIVSGYGDKEYDSSMIVGPDGKKSVGKVVKSSKWLGKIVKDVLVILQVTRYEITDGVATQKKTRTEWQAYVETSYVKRFEQGERRDVTGKTLLSWWPEWETPTKRKTAASVEVKS